ncbi:MAG: hypothetical protein KR126chlam6_01308 [Candidatus Anoxychlamydiales bacterium]|nr:hypothetical protein [Candidatus Anoxychlamydiales bacterium]
MYESFWQFFSSIVYYVNTSFNKPLKYKYHYERGLNAFKNIISSTLEIPEKLIFSYRRVPNYLKTDFRYNLEDLKFDMYLDLNDSFGVRATFEKTSDLIERFEARQLSILRRNG